MSKYLNQILLVGSFAVLYSFSGRSQNVYISDKNVYLDFKVFDNQIDSFSKYELIIKNHGEKMVYLNYSDTSMISAVLSSIGIGVISSIAPSMPLIEKGNKKIELKLLRPGEIRKYVGVFIDDFNYDFSISFDYCVLFDGPMTDIRLIDGVEYSKNYNILKLSIPIVRTH
jgi:hypothetical protein